MRNKFLKIFTALIVFELGSFIMHKIGGNPDFFLLMNGIMLLASAATYIVFAIGSE